MVAASLQKCCGDLAAVLVAVDAVIWNWTVAHEAELRVVAAALQKCGGDLAAVLATVDAVITGTELPALFLFYGFM